MNFDNLVLEGNDKFDDMTDISFENVLIPTLASQLSRFSNISSLKLSGKAFEIEGIEHEITLQELEELEIRNVRGFPWAKLNAPQLWKAVADDTAEEVIRFFCRHTSLLNLHYPVWIEENDFQALSIALPNLETLETGGAVKKFFPVGKARDTRPFPNLISLTLDLTDCQVPLNSFERFIRGRLPVQPAKGGSGQPGRLRSFAITDYAADFDDSGIENSKLLEGCLRSRVDWEDGDDEMVTFEINWSE